MTTLRAVLFDMDGTLTDSEKLWTVALDRAAADLGGALSAATRKAMIGHDMADSIRMLQSDVGSMRPYPEVAALLTTYTAELFAQPLPWRPGAQDLLHAVRDAGLATALVTATHRSLVELALNTVGHANFDVLVCGDEVANAKPHPEPYRRAVELLGVPLEQCVAIEDSPNGSSSALAAGLPVLVVPCETEVAPREGLTFAASLTDITVDDLVDLRAAAL